MKEEVSDPEHRTQQDESCLTPSNMEAETGRGNVFKHFNTAITSVITFISVNPPKQACDRLTEHGDEDSDEAVLFF